jgi:hypothetical protein
VGVQDDEHLKFHRLLPKGIESAIVQLVPVDIGVDFEPVEAEIPMGPDHLGDGGGRMIEGEVGHPHESVRVIGDDAGDAVVLDRSHPGAGRLVQVVEVLRRGDGQHLHVDPLEVHVADPGLRVGELVDLGRAELAVVSAALLRLMEKPGIELRPKKGRGDFGGCRHFDVGMHIDRPAR